MEIYTIGYTAFSEFGNPDISEFISALKLYNISCLIDVRSEPNSKTRPEFNKLKLEKDLKESGILYRNYAVEFGARQNDESFFDKTGDLAGKLNFEKFIQSKQFQSGIDKLKKGIKLNYTFCLMCAEKDPITCHRALMVGRGLKEAGFNVKHIKKLENGASIETQEDLEKRLSTVYKIKTSDTKGQLSLFGNINEEFYDELTIDDYYREGNKKIGYSLETENDEDY